MAAALEVGMSKEFTQNRDAIIRRVKESLRKAEGIASTLRKTNTRLLVASISSSAISTLVAGITAAQGPVIGVGIDGWRVTCIIAAVFAFVSTVSTGLSQQLRISDRLSGGNQCVGRLRSLEVTIATGSHSWEEIVSEYEGIVRTYPELIS
jgi:hypothetical protein